MLRKGFDNLLIVLYKFFSATMQLHHLMTTVLTHTFISGRFHNYNFILNKKRAFQTDERLLYIFRKILLYSGHFIQRSMLATHHVTFNDRFILALVSHYSRKCIKLFSKNGSPLTLFLNFIYRIVKSGVETTVF